METSSQQDLERKMAGLRNEVQVLIISFALCQYSVLCSRKILQLIHYFSVLLRYSAWNTQ